MADLPPDPDTNDDTSVDLDRRSAPKAPRWVKVFGIVAIVIAILIVIGLATGKVGPGGPHGPSRHLPGGNTPTQQAP
ncbi:MAG: hypothetical protein ACRD1T_28070 [Acidimicrobiia bacterium]